MASQYGGNYGLTQFAFDPDLDLKTYPVWIADLVHAPTPRRPLSAWLWCDGSMRGTRYGTEMMCMPESKGWDMRLINGYLYLAVIECEVSERQLYVSELVKPQQIPKQVDFYRIQRPEFRPKEFFTVEKAEDAPTREQLFRERIRTLIENYDETWKWSMSKWATDDIGYFTERCHPDQLKQISNMELWELFNDALVRIHHGWWKIHMIWMYPAYGLYTLFTQLSAELTGIDVEHPTFKALLGGFDNELFRINRELWGLGDRARELGLADLFLSTTDDEELMAKLEQSDGGRKWLSEYHEFVNRFGWRLLDTWDVATPSWIEKPSLGLRDVRSGIAKGGAFTLDAERERLAKSREEAEKEILSKVPGAQREWFTALMKLTQKCGTFSEEHNVFIDCPAMAILRHLFMEYGRRFTKAGVIDDPDDIVFIFPEQVRKAAISMERINLRPYVEKNKKEWQENCKVPPEPFIGDATRVLEAVRKDAIIQVAVAIPRVRPELKADLYGASSIPGVVEGVARVVLTERELNTVEPGEILVAPGTSVPWTAIFNIISAVVTDAGGSLAHASIVAREYNIPAVIGTMEATKKIKTGDRLRVDGNMNAVYILEKAA